MKKKESRQRTSEEAEPPAAKWNAKIETEERAIAIVFLGVIIITKMSGIFKIHRVQAIVRDQIEK